MARCRFVQPEVDRLQLSDGDYVDIKRELSAGEQNDLLGDLIEDYTAGEKVKLKPKEVARARLRAYIVGWSFTDPDGRPVPVSASSIYNIDQDTQAEIVAAIDAHEAVRKAQREEERKNLTGVSGSNPV